MRRSNEKTSGRSQTRMCVAIWRLCRMTWVSIKYCSMLPSSLWGKPQMIEDYFSSLDSSLRLRIRRPWVRFVTICQSTPFFLLVDSHTVLASTNASIMFALSTVPTHLSKHIGRWSYYCSANVTYVVIRDIIPNDEKKFLHESLLSHVRSSEEFSFCPTLDRQLAYRTGV